MNNDPYWTLDTSLFDGQFRYFGKEPVLVRGKIHTEQERYSKGDVNQEITPISVTSGTRTYLDIRPYVLIPDIRLTIGLYQNPAPSGAIGEVLNAQEKRQKEVEIGNCQAWRYPDETLVLWECYLNSFVSDQPIDANPNMAALWKAIEAFLVQQFPASKQIVTTAYDPMFETRLYQAFLTGLGYAPVAKAAYGKLISS